jgi:hypothetical protein
MLNGVQVLVKPNKILVMLYNMTLFRRTSERSTGIFKQSSAVWDRRLPLRLNIIIPYSGLLRGVDRFKIKGSGVPIYPIFNGEASPWTAWLFKREAIGNNETSVLNQITPCNNQTDGRVQSSVQSHIEIQWNCYKWLNNTQVIEGVL